MTNWNKCEKVDGLEIGRQEETWVNGMFSGWHLTEHYFKDLAEFKMCSEDHLNALKHFIQLSEQLLKSKSSIYPNDRESNTS